MRTANRRRAILTVGSFNNAEMGSELSLFGSFRERGRDGDNVGGRRTRVVVVGWKQ
ncbi:uncharacterized protein J3R85_017379 [Psidium guajava]|nr:uncharacterized protein J3R85_017379 [Psidium guajava]